MINFEKYREPYAVRAYIYSLNKGKSQSTETDEVTILGEKTDGTQKLYIVDYKGIKCSAIFNWFSCAYYADDVYGVIKE